MRREQGTKKLKRSLDDDDPINCILSRDIPFVTADSAENIFMNEKHSMEPRPVQDQGICMFAVHTVINAYRT